MKIKKDTNKEIKLQINLHTIGVILNGVVALGFLIGLFLSSNIIIATRCLTFVILYSIIVLLISLHIEISTLRLEIRGK